MNIPTEYNKRHCHLTYNKQWILFSISFFLILPLFAQQTDVRSNALGGCGATQQNIWSNFSNPAGLPQIEKFSVGLSSHNTFGLKELNTHALAFALPTKSGVFGINLTYSGFELFNETRVGLSFGKKLSQTLNLGVQMDYFNMHISENQTDPIFTFELGMQKKITEQLHVGIHLFNPLLVKRKENELLPSQYKLGMAYGINKKVTWLMESELNNMDKLKVKSGIEYRLVKQFQLRYGISSNPIKNHFGVGYTLQNIQIDFAIDRHQVLGYSPQFAISSSF